MTFHILLVPLRSLLETLTGRNSILFMQLTLDIFQIPDIQTL